MRKSLLAAALLFASPALAPAAAAATDLTPYKQAAAAKDLPTKFFDELIQHRAQITLRYTSGGPSYTPGAFGGGTIRHPSIGSPFTEWRRGDWSTFYNELFHAWWGNVFLKVPAYATDRGVLLNDPALRTKYTAAHNDWRLAQEEAYSETVASIMIWAYPQMRLDPDTGDYVYVTPPYETLYFQIDRTVAPVSHSDRPGYKPAAEEIYPDEAEYGRLMPWMFGRAAPPRP